MGVVYVARDPELDREVAIEVLRSDFARAHPDAARRIIREARAMAKLSHPNVVAVYDVGTIDDQVFVAMERITGTSLREWLGERPRSLGEILAVFTEAGRGLTAAHDAGIVHRDFKPDNVLVGRDGRARVTDFGLAYDGGDEARRSSRSPTRSRCCPACRRPHRKTSRTSGSARKPRTSSVASSRGIRCSARAG